MDRDPRALPAGEGSAQPYDRAQFKRLLHAETARLNRHGGDLGLIAFAMDDLDAVRTRLGADSTEQLLSHLATAVGSHVRASDVLGRWDDGLFMVLAPAMDLNETTGFAVKLRRLIADYRHNGSGLVTASLGVTAYRRSETPDEFVERAQRALGRARENGGNRIGAARPAEGGA